MRIYDKQQLELGKVYILKLNVSSFKGELTSKVNASQLATNNPNGNDLLKWFVNVSFPLMMILDPINMKRKLIRFFNTLQV